jgi:hypothetical protein
VTVGADVVFGVNAPSATSWTSPPDGSAFVGILSPALNPALVDRTARPSYHRALDGSCASHLSGPVSGRAALPRGSGGRTFLRPVLHRTGDRNRQRPSCQSCRCRGGVAGLRRSAQRAVLAPSSTPDPRAEVVVEQVRSLGGSTSPSGRPECDRLQALAGCVVRGCAEPALLSRKQLDAIR